MSRRTTVVQQKKKRKANRLLPVLGIALAITFAVIAYFLLEPVRGYLRAQGVTSAFDPQLADLLIGGVLWLLMFGTAMFLVSIVVGRDPAEKQSIEFSKQAAKRKKREKAERELRKKRKREFKR